MIIPLWQYPHCGTSLAIQASCTLCSAPSPASPSMVVICLPTASLTTMPHDRTATPSTWTVQAPHCAMPQPYLVPVRPAFSRKAHRSGVSGSTSTSKVLPLIMWFAIADPLVGSIHQLNFREAGLEAGIVQIKILRFRRMGIIGLLRRHPRTRDDLLPFRPQRDHLGS